MEGGNWGPNEGAARDHSHLATAVPASVGSSQENQDSGLLHSVRIMYDASSRTFGKRHLFGLIAKVNHVVDPHTLRNVSDSAKTEPYK